MKMELEDEVFWLLRGSTPTLFDDEEEALDGYVKAIQEGGKVSELELWMVHREEEDWKMTPVGMDRIIERLAGKA